MGTEANPGEGPSHDVGDRAISTTIGFILIFSFLILTFTLYQGLVVPEQNRQAEFNHNEALQSQLQDVRNAIWNTVDGTDHAARVTLGPDYPQRTIAKNLGIGSGTLRTVDPDSDVLIENVTAIDSETADYFGTQSTQLGPFDAKSLRYDPNYVRYKNAPATIYENTVAYNRFTDGGNLTLTGQELVDGRRITLVVLSGNLSKATDNTVTVDTRAVSTSTDRIAVTNESGRLNVTIPTRLPASKWSELLSDEMDGAGSDDQYVVSVQDTGENQVSILFEQGVTYDLRLAKIGVGSGVGTEDAHYITDVSGNGTGVAENGRRKLVVEVRDRFNNPVSNVTVQSAITTSAGTGDTVTPATVVTDEDGHATFTYTPPEDVDGTQRAEVRLHFNSTTTARENVTIDVTVHDSDGSGGGCSGPGTGSTSPWCSNASTTISQSGGVISGIGSASHITISDPSFTSIRPDNGQVRTASERFRLAFVIEKDQADLTGTTRYMFVISNTEEGFTQAIDDSKTAIKNRKIGIYKDASVNDDGAGYVKFVNPFPQPKSAELKPWYKDQNTIDLLDASYYSGIKQSDLSEIRTFIQNNDVRIYIVDMEGRVDLVIE